MKFITQPTSPKRLILPCLVGGFIGGFFGSGGGVILIFILKRYYGNIKEIFPTVIMLTLFSSAVNSSLYSHYGQIPSVSPVYFISGIIGAFCGCALFSKFKLKFLSVCFAVLTAICGIIMIL